MQAKAVGSRDEVLQVVKGAELRIDLVVVLHGIWAAEGALAVQFADGMDGHEPDDTDTKFLQAGKFLFRSLQCACLGELAQVHLVDTGGFDPCGMGKLHVRLRLVDSQAGSSGV